MKAPSFLRRGGLFAKYFLSLVGIVTLVLLINGAFDMWFAYGTARQALGRLQQEQANGAADKVGRPRTRNGPPRRSTSGASISSACSARCRPSPS